MTEIAIANQKTMISREIADLVEKRHDNVKRTIEALVNQGLAKLANAFNLQMEAAY